MPGDSGPFKIMETDLTGLPRASDQSEKVDTSSYDAILIVGFGGPECREDVLPFLENVTRGRNVPRERLLEVAGHYDHFGGVSPINSQIRDLMASLRLELDRHAISLAIYWGNRNWHPMLADTLAEMASHGVKRALAVVHAAYSSYSSCRQYREDIARAQAVVGTRAPEVDKIRVFYNHPDFIAANAERVRDALDQVLPDTRHEVHLAFTAHSIPLSMARNCKYEHQLTEACRLIAEHLGVPADRWALVYQSRSGRPGDPWLEPDILDHLKDLRQRGIVRALIHPIGFLSDHIEVLYDLDEEARVLCEELGLFMVRARTVGTHPRFIRMLRELIAERMGIVPESSRRSLGRDGPSHDVCSESCCLLR
jgi:protoporphyrin/coproporphyrin ferrochelatase